MPPPFSGFVRLLTRQGRHAKMARNSAKKDGETRVGKPSGGSFIGLDIGSQTIKAVEVRGAGTGLQISALGIENTPPGAIQGGVITDPKALGAAIKAVLSKNGIKASRCVSAAAGAASVVVRVIEVPRMTPAELAETMKWEVERHIPFAANDVEMAYQTIDDPAAAADPNNPNMEVLLAVAQRDMVAAHIETLQAAGLNPIAVDVEPLAAGRALINVPRNGLDQKNVVVVNIGAANTDVSIFKGGTLRFPRSFPIAGDNFTRAIADHIGMGMDAAEEEKRENATVFMDLIGGGAGLGDDFGGAAPAGDIGRTPFDFAADVNIPMNTPFASTPAADEGLAPVSASPFDMTGDVPSAPVELSAEPTIPPPAAASPFDTSDPFAAAMVGSPTTAAGPLANVPTDDPRTRRRREIFDALLPVLGEFAGEVRRSVDYFRSRYPNDTLDQIILCGGSARIPNLDQFLQSDLGVTTVVADPFAGINVSSRQMSSERLQDVAPAFAVAVGLATRDALLGSDKK